MRLFSRVVLFLIALTVSSASFAEQIYPMQYRLPDGTYTTDVGLFNRRKSPPETPPAVPQNPEGSNRTVPFQPSTPPQFESAPADGSTVDTAISPETWTKIINAVIPFIAALIGALGGTGSLGPLLGKLLQALAGSLSGAASKVGAPAPAPPAAPTTTPAPPEAGAVTPVRVS